MEKPAVEWLKTPTLVQTLLHPGGGLSDAYLLCTPLSSVASQH